MRPPSLFVRAVLTPPAKIESQKPGLDGDRLRPPQNLLQRATMRA